MINQIVNAATKGNTEELNQLISSAAVNEESLTFIHTIGNVILHLSTLGEDQVDLVMSSMDEKTRFGVSAELIKGGLETDGDYALKMLEAIRTNIAKDQMLELRVLNGVVISCLGQNKLNLAKKALEHLSNRNPEVLDTGFSREIQDDKFRVLLKIGILAVSQNLSPPLVRGIINCFSEDDRAHAITKLSALCLEEKKGELLKVIVNSADNEIKNRNFASLINHFSERGRQDLLEELARNFPYELEKIDFNLKTKQQLKTLREKAAGFIRNNQYSEFKGLINGLQSDNHKKDVLTNTAAICASKGNEQGLRKVLEFVKNDDSYVEVAGTSLAYAAQKGTDKVLQTFGVIDGKAASQKEIARSRLQNRHHSTLGENHPILVRLDEKAGETFGKITQKAEQLLKKVKPLNNLREGISQRNSLKNADSKPSEVDMGLERLTIVDTALRNRDPEPEPRQRPPKNVSPKRQPPPSRRPSLG